MTAVRDVVRVVLPTQFGEFAVTAFEVYLGAQRPTAPLYVQYASYAYEAQQTRKAELASKKALALAGKDDQEQIKSELQSIRQQASVAASRWPPGRNAVHVHS